MEAGGLTPKNLIQSTISLEMPVPSKGHCVFPSFRLLTDLVCLLTYEFCLSLWKIARCSVILLLPLPLRVFILTLLKMYGYYIEVHVKKRINNIQNTASACFPDTWISSLRGMFHLCVMLECFSGTSLSSRRGVFTCPLRYDVSRVHGPALYDVCFTCILR